MRQLLPHEGKAEISAGGKERSTQIPPRKAMHVHCQRVRLDGAGRVDVPKLASSASQLRFL